MCRTTGTHLHRWSKLGEHTLTHAYRQHHHRYKLQPGVTPQVKSLLCNLWSAVKVATMTLQGPHTLCIELSCSGSLPLFIIFPPPDNFLPTCSKMCSTSEQSNDKHIQSTAMWSQGRLVVGFSPAPSPLFPLSQGKQMRPHVLFSLMRLNQSDDAGSCL